MAAVLITTSGANFTDDLLDLLALREVERVARRGQDVVARKGFDDSGPDLAARSGDEDAHGWAVYGPPYGQGSDGAAGSVVVVAGDVSSTGAPISAVPLGTVVVVDGTVSALNDEPSTSATASFAVGSGTSLASVKYGSSALASSAWPYP